MADSARHYMPATGKSASTPLDGMSQVTGTSILDVVAARNTCVVGAANRAKIIVLSFLIN